MNERTFRVLIVDPDSVFAGKIGAALSSHGFEVETTAGITRAAQRLMEVDFGCVVLDENLMEIKGYDAVPVLKAISPRTPIIVTASQNTLKQEARIRQQDIFFYYVKSFDLQELQMAVGDACRKISGIREKSLQEVKNHDD